MKGFIVIDLQNDYLPKGNIPLVNVEESIKQAATILNKVRENEDYFVVHVRHEFEDENAPFLAKNSDGSKIVSIVENKGDEVVITKHHPNSFLETNLHEVLTSKGITDLTIVGAMAQTCVQGTVRAAAELGYSVTVVYDAVPTRDLEFRATSVPAKYVALTVFATLEFGYAKLLNTVEYLKLMQN